MPRDSRDRITVDLRGAGQRIHESAAARGMTVAAFVRRAALAAADEAPETAQPRDDAAGMTDRTAMKVTLRLPAVHALLLARRARSAEVSQGAYLAGLIEGTPRPPWPDRRETIAALARSTDQLAILGTDLNTFIRLMQRGATAPPESCGSGMTLLSTALRSHLDLACRFLADIGPPTSSRSGNGPASRRR